MINSKEVIESLSWEDIQKIMHHMGADEKRTSKDNELLFRSICHHSNSFKLYFYKDSKFFHCKSCCGSMSLFDVVSNIQGFYGKEKFKQSFNYICDFFNIDKNESKNKKHGFGKQNENLEEEFKILNSHKKRCVKREFKMLPTYKETYLNLYQPYYPIEWLEEGITEEVMDSYGIKMDLLSQQIIIPHRDIFERLVGIRCRNYKQELLQDGKKYMPVYIGKECCSYPMEFNLYGLWRTKDNIIQQKRIVLFESEKSPLKICSLFGEKNNISVATCSMNFSVYQRDILLLLGVEEINICYDKQYELDRLDYFKDKRDKDLTKEELIDKEKKIKEYNSYFKKLLKIYKLVGNYMQMYVIADFENRLEYKDAPIDKGKEIYEELFRERKLIYDESILEDMLIKEV
jgi:hypothetical protein